MRDRIVAMLTLLSLTPCAAAATLRVPTAEFATIQRALDFAETGDTILVGPGEYIVVTPLVISRIEPKDVILRSESGPEVTTIRLSSEPVEPRTALILAFGEETAATRIEGFSFQSTPGPGGTGQITSIVSAAAPVFSNCIFRDSLGGRRGILGCFGTSSPTFESCEFIDNRGAAALTVAVAARVVVRNCRFLRNETLRSNGGAMVISSREATRIEGCVFENNTALAGGGLFLQSSSTTEITDCVFRGNSAASSGGAVQFSAGDLEIRDSLFEENSSARGGAIELVGNGSLSITGSTFLSNRGSQSAVLDLRGRSPARIDGCLFAANDARGPSTSGGAIRVSVAREVTTIASSTIADTLGAALVTDGSALSLEGTVVWGNWSALESEGGSTVTATACCLQSLDGFESKGSRVVDPVFCGLSSADPVHVTDRDALVETIRTYSWALAGSSPCASIGAGLGECELDGPPTRELRLGPGEYDLTAITLNIRISGTSPEETRITGPVLIGNGADLASLTVTGGLVVAGGGTSRVEGCVVREAESSGVHVEAGARLDLLDCEIVDNTGVVGAGLQCARSSTRVERCRIAGNVASRSGGGVFAAGAGVELVDCVIEANEAPRGGGIESAGQSRLALSGGTISRNVSLEDQGGGISITNSVLEAAGTTISQNAAALGGGGIAVGPGGEIILSGVDITSNASVRGGGLLGSNTSSMTVLASRLLGNHADFDGGAAACLGDAGARFENCVISGNVAGIDGGAISANLGGRIVAVNCSLAGNRAGRRGGAVASLRHEARLANSIVWSNAPDGFHGLVATRFTTHQGDRTGPGDRSGDPRFVDEGAFDLERFEELAPGLRAADFVLRAPDLRLRDDSPAIDAGELAGAPPEDIDGIARPCGPGVDMGAHEAGSCRVEPFIRGDVNGDTAVNVTDAVALLDALFRGGTGPTCEDAADADDSGDLAITDGIFILRFLFGGGDPPPTPGPERCGRDSGEDNLGCASFEACSRAD